MAKENTMINFLNFSQQAWNKFFRFSYIKYKLTLNFYLHFDLIVLTENAQTTIQ